MARVSRVNNENMNQGDGRQQRPFAARGGRWQTIPRTVFTISVFMATGERATGASKMSVAACCAGIR